MWFTITTVIFIVPATTTITNITKATLFTNKQVIFSSTFNITSILVPADGSKYVQAESSELPSIFFTVSDSRFEGGSCIYVLEDLAAYEILESGRDSTADYGTDHNVYFGAKDGLYKYDRESLSAKRFGPFKDNIIQIQKANGTDAIYYLTNERKMFKVEKGGTIKTKLRYVVCAAQFVLDTSNNLYYVDCHIPTIHIVKADGSVPEMMPSSDEFVEIKLLRPAFIMDNCIPFFGDGSLHIIYANGTCEKKDLTITERPSAFSVDAALYLVAALNGKIYEYNVMEILVKSMFRMGTHKLEDVSKILLSVIGSPIDNIFGFHEGWYHN